MLWSELSKVFAQVEATTLRNEKTMLLASLWKELTSQEVAQVAYLAVGRLGPLYDPLEFGLAGKMVVRAVAWGVGVKGEEIEKQFKQEGDLGEVIQRFKRDEIGVRNEQMNIGSVYSELKQVAEEKGAGSQERKIERLGRLLRRMEGIGAKYVVRLVMGKLRLGFSDLTMLDSLSWAQTGSKADRDVLEGAYNVWSDIGAVASLYKEQGLAGLAKLDVVPGRPVKPMRAERLGTTSEIVAKLGNCAVEPKLDGMRVQIHAWSNAKTNQQSHKLTKQQGGFFDAEIAGVQVKIFSRGLEDITHQFPEIVAASEQLQARVGDIVLDGEAIGVNKITGEYLPFQETMTRKRKHGVGNKAEETPLKVIVFDVLFAREQGRLTETYEKRRKILEDLGLKSYGLGILELAESTVVASEPELRQLFDQYMEQKLEGVLVKRPDSHYLAGARNFNWVKYKRAHEKTMVDTVDCVVMGYYKGKGKRQKFGLGAFLVGVGERDKIVTVGKVGTGLTDEQFESLYQRLKTYELGVKSEQYVVAKSLEPDVWVEPKIVVEIEADEITRSPVHSAGYALRFPRLARFRDDKNLGEITTKDEIAAMSRL